MGGTTAGKRMDAQPLRVPKRMRMHAQRNAMMDDGVALAFVAFFEAKTHPKIAC
jgi:hypothetical protein